MNLTGYVLIINSLNVEQNDSIGELEDALSDAPQLHPGEDLQRTGTTAKCHDSHMIS